MALDGWCPHRTISPSNNTASLHHHTIQMLVRETLVITIKTATLFHNTHNNRNIQCMVATGINNQATIVGMNMGICRIMRHQVIRHRLMLTNRLKDQAHMKWAIIHLQVIHLQKTKVFIGI